MPSSSTVPSRFADKRLADFNPNVSASAALALEAADEFVGGAIDGLVLVGPPGVGKTHVAAGIVNEIKLRNTEDYQRAIDAMTDRYPAVPQMPLWANVASLIVGLRLDMDRPLDDRDSQLLASRLRKHPAAVVLDDLGREKASDWTGEVIYTVVNDRYEAGLPTIITSNLTPELLRSSTYWPSISRIAEGGRLIEFKVTGDYRLRKG